MHVAYVSERDFNGHVCGMCGYYPDYPAQTHGVNPTQLNVMVHR